MERLVIVGLITLVAIAIAVVMSRRTPPQAPAPTGFHVPVQLDRADFARPQAEWLVVVFTSATCTTCAEMVTKVEALASDAVAIDDVEVSARRDLHDRYKIDAVPTTLIVDADGVVRQYFLGTVKATELWDAVAAQRAGLDEKR